MVKGDIVLIQFPFTDLSASKLRPAVVLSHSDMDVMVCFITTRLVPATEIDIVLNPSFINGLRKTSLVRVNKIATLEKRLIKGLLGKLDNEEINQLNLNLKLVLQLT